MEKQQYEQLKKLKIKMAKGTATFAERNFIAMHERKMAKMRKQLTNAQRNSKKLAALIDVHLAR